MQMVPPSYDDVISEDEVLGSEEDLAKAATLVPHARIYASLRASEEAMSIKRVNFSYYHKNKLSHVFSNFFNGEPQEIKRPFKLKKTLKALFRA